MSDVKISRTQTIVGYDFRSGIDSGLDIFRGRGEMLDEGKAPVVFTWEARKDGKKAHLSVAIILPKNAPEEMADITKRLYPAILDSIKPPRKSRKAFKIHVGEERS
jgi:hypothetical protein